MISNPPVRAAIPHEPTLAVGLPSSTSDIRNAKANVVEWP
jgi:hypothetical protein